jgi:hypothetical protein
MHMPRVTLYIPGDLKARMDEIEAVNWSAIAQQAFKEVVINLAARKETATMDDVVERLRASKESYVETEHKAGLRSGRSGQRRLPNTASCCVSLRQWRRPEGKSTSKLCRI